MELNEAKTSRINAKRKLRTSGGLFDLDALDGRIAEIEQEMAQPGTFGIIMSSTEGHCGKTIF